MFVPSGQFERLVFIYFSLHLNKLQFLNQLKIGTLLQSPEISLSKYHVYDTIANQKRAKYGIKILVN